METTNRRCVKIDITVQDAVGGDWALSDHLDSAVLFTFHRGDF